MKKVLLILGLLAVGCTPAIIGVKGEIDMKWLLHTGTGNLVLLVGVCAAGATALGLMVRRKIRRV